VLLSPSVRRGTFGPSNTGREHGGFPLDSHFFVAPGLTRTSNLPIRVALGEDCVRDSLSPAA
jgi:hypothetical protein